MAGMTKPLSTILVAAVLIMAVIPRSEAEITCGMVVNRLTPCLPYVTDKGPIGKCCEGVKTLHESAKTTPERQKVCNCLKEMANSFPGINYDKAAALPKECGVDIPYVISPTVDCSKVE